MQWLDIETAPVGERLLVKYNDSFKEIVYQLVTYDGIKQWYRDGGEVIWKDESQPTQWMQLPD